MNLPALKIRVRLSWSLATALAAIAMTATFPTAGGFYLLGCNLVLIVLLRYAAFHEGSKQGYERGGRAAVDGAAIRAACEHDRKADEI